VTDAAELREDAELIREAFDVWDYEDGMYVFGADRRKALNAAIDRLLAALEEAQRGNKHWYEQFHTQQRRAEAAEAALAEARAALKAICTTNDAPPDTPRFDADYPGPPS
jgi:hypothetical protein